MNYAYRVIKTADLFVYLFSAETNASLITDSVPTNHPFLAQARDEALRCGVVIPTKVKTRAQRSGELVKSVLFQWDNYRVVVSNWDFGLWSPYMIGSKSARMRSSREFRSPVAESHVQQVLAMGSADDAIQQEAVRAARRQGWSRAKRQKKGSGPAIESEIIFMGTPRKVSSTQDKTQPVEVAPRPVESAMQSEPENSTVEAPRQAKRRHL